MAKLYNLARMTTATTGTGTITLGSAVSSYLSFADAGVQNSDTVTYAISDGTNREIGRGVYTSSGTTLTRAQILESTNGGSAINLSGSAEVFITAAGEDITSDVQITGGSITGITDLAVADGGTGKSSFTAYSVLLGGTTSTGALQNVSGVGSSGQVLTSAGASAVPTWSSSILAPTLTGTITEDIFAITDGAAFEVDPANGSIQTITLGASRTPKATNFQAGQGVTLMVDDGTAYTITWTDSTWGTSGVKWVGGSAPTLATTGYTVIEFWKVGTQVYGALVGAA